MAKAKPARDERPFKAKVKELAWPILPKPWDSATMEFDYGLWHGLSALMSDSGRQLGEGNTRPQRLNLDIAAQKTPCNFEGNRNRKDINLSALAIAMRHFDEALLICSAVRQVHTERLGPERQNAPLGIWDIYIISRSCLALIAFIKRSTASHTEMKTVPDVLVSVYQFVTGLFMIGRDMMQNSHPAAIENSPISAQELYDYADEHRIFESANGMVCAGSTRKIIEFLDVFDLGSREAWPDATFDLSDLVNTPAMWRDYAVTTIDLEWFIIRQRLQAEIARAGREAGQKRQVLEIYDALSAYLGRHFSAPVFDPELAPAAAALRHQNMILQHLGRRPAARLNDRMVRYRFGLS